MSSDCSSTTCGSDDTTVCMSCSASLDELSALSSQPSHLGPNSNDLATSLVVGHTENEGRIIHTVRLMDQLARPNHSSPAPRKEAVPVHAVDSE